VEETSFNVEEKEETAMQETSTFVNLEEQQPHYEEEPD